MNRAVVVSILLLALGLTMSVFVRKITAESNINTDPSKALVSIKNDLPKKEPIRVYRGATEQKAGTGVLVNPDYSTLQPLGENETLSIYIPSKNATYHLSLTKKGERELLPGKKTEISLKKLDQVTQETSTSDNNILVKYGSTDYFNIEFEAVSAYSDSGSLY